MWFRVCLKNINDFFLVREMTKIEVVTIIQIKQKGNIMGKNRCKWNPILVWKIAFTTPQSPLLETLIIVDANIWDFVEEF